MDSTQTSQSPTRRLSLPGANQSWDSWLGPKRVKGCVYSSAAQCLSGTHNTQESTSCLHSHYFFHAESLTWPWTWRCAQLHRKGRYLQQRSSVSLLKPAQTKATMMPASKREKPYSLDTSEHCLPSAGGSYVRHVNCRRAWKSENLQPSWIIVSHRRVFSGKQMVHLQGLAGSCSRVKQGCTGSSEKLL